MTSTSRRRAGEPFPSPRSERSETPSYRETCSDDASCSSFGGGSDDDLLLPDQNFILNKNSTFHDHFTWIEDQKDRFKVAPRRFRSGRVKVIWGVFHMDRTLRGRWYSHVRALATEEERDRAKNSWKVLEAWVKDLALCKGDPALQAHEAYRNAHQRPNQTPLSFLSYLQSLEADMEPLPEDYRKRTFYLGLQDSVREALERDRDCIMASFQSLATRAQNVWEQIRSNKRGAHGRSSTRGRGSKRRRGNNATTL